MRSGRINAQKKESSFVSFDKTPIHYDLYDGFRNGGTPGPSGGIRANLLVVHGSGEHAGRYAGFGGYLAQRGIRVYVVDLRGYGRSGGRRAYARRMSDFGRDLDALLALMEKRHDGGLFLLGHSLGGLIASYNLAYTVLRPLRGLILSSPCFALERKVPWHIHALAVLSSKLWPTRLYPTDPRPEILTHDPEVVNHFWEDTALTHKMSAGLYVLMRRTFARSLEIARRITCPVLVLQAGDDRVVKVEATRAFYEQLKSQDKTLKVYEGFFHEILQERDRVKVYEDILRWLEAHA